MLGKGKEVKTEAVDTTSGYDESGFYSDGWNPENDSKDFVKTDDDDDVESEMGANKKLPAKRGPKKGNQIHTFARLILTSL